MSRQGLLYESAVPLSAARHAGVSVDATRDYAFTAGVNAVPLMAVEFARAAAEYAIVFGRAGDEVHAAAVLGLRGDQNLYLAAADHHWQARYVPAFIRRYPFVVAAGADRQTLVLCIDETHAGVNREGRGQRLFGDDGQPSDYTRRVLQFLQQYQLQFERTRVFCRRLQELDLLEPMKATLTRPGGQAMELGSFLAVSSRKLKALDDATLAQLVRGDALELIHLHQHSLRNFDEVKGRFLEAIGEGGEAPASTPSPAPATTP